MNAEQRSHVENWIAALRSGKYPKTRGVLHRLVPSPDRPVGYCCLGVLAAEAGLNSNFEDGVNERFQFPFGLYGFKWDDSLPHPGWFSHYTGFSTIFMHTLASCNDGGYSFNVIANRIESELKVMMGQNS